MNMICSRCNIEMKDDYCLRLGFGGKIKIDKPRTVDLDESLKVYICPVCHKVELYYNEEKQ